VPDPDSLPPDTFSAARSAIRPAAICHGLGHIVKYGNAAFIAAFGDSCVGMPARECLLALPADAFALLDIVLSQGRPFSRWVRFGEDEWRMTAAPRVDHGTGEIYGVAFHLRSRYDLPVLAYGPDEGGAHT
jgi:hypothetical protein